MLVNFLNKKSSIPPPPSVDSVNIVFDGDSLTFLNKYPMYILYKLRDDGYTRKITNRGVSGATTAMRLAVVDNTIEYYDASYDKNILCWWIGTNDVLGDYPLVDLDNELKAYYNAVKSKFKVLLIGTTDLVPDTEDYSAQVNQMYADNWQGNYADAYLNLRSDSRYQDASNTIYFYDGIHMTDLGFQGVADLAYPKILTFINT